MTKQPDRERHFEILWNELAPIGMEPVREYRFHPTRRWRFDFAWLEQKVAVEIEGGTFTGGRHTTGAGHHGDCKKYNEAVYLGWKVLRFTSSHLDKEPRLVIDQVVALLKGKPTCQTQPLPRKRKSKL